MLDAQAMAAMILADVTTPPEGLRSYTLTVTTAVDDTDYVFTVTFGTGLDAGVVTYTINSGPGATTASIAAAIRTALTNDTNNDGPGGLDAFITEGGGAGSTAIVEGVLPGTFFTVAESDANLSLTGPVDAAYDSTELEVSTNAIVGEVMTPAALTGNVNDYDPADAGGVSFDNATLLRVDGGAANRTITGIVPYHRTLIITNITAANTLILSHDDAASAAANRFLFPGAANRVLAINEAVILVYDPTSARWRAAS